MTQTYDRRPGEVGILATRRAIVSSPLRRDGIGSMFAYCLEADVVYLVDEPLARDFAQDHAVTIVQAEAGALPTALPPSEQHQARTWLRGPRRLSFAERVDDATKRFDLRPRAGAEAFVNLVLGGFDPQDAAALIRERYDRLVVEQGLYRFDWGAFARGLLEARDSRPEVARP